MQPACCCCGIAEQSSRRSFEILCQSAFVAGKTLRSFAIRCGRKAIRAFSAGRQSLIAGRRIVTSVVVMSELPAWFSPGRGRRKRTISPANLRWLDPGRQVSARLLGPEEREVYRTWDMLHPDQPRRNRTGFRFSAKRANGLKRNVRMWKRSTQRRLCCSLFAPHAEGTSHRYLKAANIWDPLLRVYGAGYRAFYMDPESDAQDSLPVCSVCAILCESALRRGQLPKFCRANSFDFGAVPDCLLQLNDMGRRMISL